MNNEWEDSEPKYQPGQLIEVEHTFPGVVIAHSEPGYYIITSILPEHMLNAMTPRRRSQFLRNQLTL